jgi:hypothetical protein
MVGYTQVSTTLRRICNPNDQVVQAQSKLMFNEEQNAYISCTTDRIDILGLSEIQNTLRNFVLEMEFSKHPIVQLDGV